MCMMYQYFDNDVGTYNCCNDGDMVGEEDSLPEGGVDINITYL